MSSRIWHMRTYLVAPGHAVGAREAAASFLRVRQDAARKSIAELGFVAAPLRDVLEVTLGDPEKAGGPSLAAFVSGGVWIVKCECGGAEFCDFEDPIFMCSSCWNESTGRQWRTVALPSPKLREAIEGVLLERPVEKTRSWFLGETVADLVAQNEKRAIARGITEQALASIGEEEVVRDV